MEFCTDHIEVDGKKCKIVVVKDACLEKELFFVNRMVNLLKMVQA